MLLRDGLREIAREGNSPDDDEGPCGEHHGGDVARAVSGASPAPSPASWPNIPRAGPLIRRTPAARGGCVDSLPRPAFPAVEEIFAKRSAHRKGSRHDPTALPMSRKYSSDRHPDEYRSLPAAAGMFDVPTRAHTIITPRISPINELGKLLSTSSSAFPARRTQTSTITSTAGCRGLLDTSFPCRIPRAGMPVRPVAIENGHSRTRSTMTKGCRGDGLCFRRRGTFPACSTTATAPCRLPTATGLTRVPSPARSPRFDTDTPGEHHDRVARTRISAHRPDDRAPTAVRPHLTTARSASASCGSAPAPTAPADERSRFQSSIFNGRCTPSTRYQRAGPRSPEATRGWAASPDAITGGLLVRLDERGVAVQADDLAHEPNGPTFTTFPTLAPPRRSLR